MNVLVIGAGAVGSYYGALLARQGAQVSMLARSDYATILEQGIVIDGPVGRRHFQPRQIVRRS